VRSTAGAGRPSVGLAERWAWLRHGARLWGLFLVAAALGGAGVGLHRLVTRSPHFAVRALRLSPTRHVSTESLAARAGVVLGTNLFKVDLDEIARDVSQEPWVQSAHARRELPSTVVVDIVEREPAVAVALGPLYIADARGAVFKRANPDEAATLPVVTGIERDDYLADPEGAQARVREALAALTAWRSGSRPPVGEAHCDPLLGVTLYTVSDGVGVRLGPLDASLPERLRRFDVVWAALGRTGERARFLYLDNRARPDRVTVKLATDSGDDRPEKRDT
jgi:cell division protein FtsQ